MSAIFRRLLFIDLEVTPGGRIAEMGVVMGDDSLHIKKGAANALEQLSKFSTGACALVGHNILDHGLA